MNPTVSATPKLALSGNNGGGNWITFPFITGSLLCLNLAVAGWGSNLVVYMVEKFNMKSICAIQTFNVVSGSACLFPVIGAIIADSSLGCFSVIWISSLISLLGIILLALTAMLDPLRPLPCKYGEKFCDSPSTLQLTILYSGIALAAIGPGGTRYTIAAMGGNQFENTKDQGIFFNWFVVILYGSSILGATVIVYIEDSVSWALGFGLCVVFSIIGSAIFLLGNRYYRHVNPQGSPFTGLACVIIAAFRKRKVSVSPDGDNYFYGRNGIPEMVTSEPSNSLRFLNRAALITEADTEFDYSTSKPWSLCTVQQVENLKILMRNFPIVLSGVFLYVPIAFLRSLTVVQALTLDRHLGHDFKIPAGSLIVFNLASTAISITFVDRLLYPMWQNIIGQAPTPFQRIGFGHIFNITSAIVAALVESKRLKLQYLAGPTVPMTVLFLVPQMVLIGFGEAFHYPGQVTLYYQEFPKSLRNTATAMVSMIMGIAYYLSTALVDLVQRVTNWLPDNTNSGRLDNVYWILVGLGTLNFFYFLVCARSYKYQNQDIEK
ncbi:hypothetical protein ACFE04_007699 [Oxalis oulophora]